MNFFSYNTVFVVFPLHSYRFGINWISLDIIKYDVYSGPNIGLYTAVNDKYVFIPNGYAKSKAKKLADYLNVEPVFTSMANTRLIGAMMAPMIPKEKIKQIEDTLGVEVIQKKVAGYHQIGVMVVATMHGGVIHPEADDDEIKSIADVLGVNIEPATINGGIPYVHSGILANNHSMVVGGHTTGPEIMMLTRAFSG